MKVRRIKKFNSDVRSMAPSVRIGFHWISLTFRLVFLGNGFEGAKDKISHHALEAQMAAWSVWFPVQYFNFYMMPLHMRVVFAQSVALFWNVYMAWKVMKRY